MPEASKTSWAESASHIGMKVLLMAVVMVVASYQALAAAPGSFAGTVVSGPETSDTWLYVQGRNHSVRRVYVSGAKFRYDSEMPGSERKKPVPTSLPAGTQVRVTAEQDETGEWRATDVEILENAAPVDEKKTVGSTTSKSSSTSKK